MIENEQQYQITKTQAGLFMKALEDMRMRPARFAAALPPGVEQLQREALRSQLADLEQELREYEARDRLV